MGLDDIYIIVHEEDVARQAKARIGRAKDVFAEIQRIKSEEQFREVTGEPDVIPGDLPPPSQCRIHVCGSSVAVCLGVQRTVLMSAGYTTFLHWKGSVPYPT